MVALLLCAIASTTGVDLRLAPPVPPWPEVAPVPAALLTPSEGRIYLDGEEISVPGLWLPDELAGEVNARLEMLDVYPARCQARLDGLGRVHDVVLRGAVEAAWADAERQVDKGWAWWEVALVGVGAGAVGVLVGLVAGFAVAR